jgi:WD40 repeat protein
MSTVASMHDGQPGAPFAGHPGPVLSVAVTPDGEEVITTGDDGTIRVWNRRRGRQVHGTQLGGIGPARRLATLRSDQPSAVDLLDFGSDVETLAALVAATTTEPPLSIALLGEWGSGKSSFMVQMQAEVSRLAELSGNNLGQSVFAANVRQVRFNAWHYSDDHLWAGLVEHLFRSLAQDDAGPGDGTGDAHPQADTRDLTDGVPPQP